MWLPCLVFHFAYVCFYSFLTLFSENFKLRGKRQESPGTLQALCPGCSPQASLCPGRPPGGGPAEATCSAAPRVPGSRGSGGSDTAAAGLAPHGAPLGPSGAVHRVSAWNPTPPEAPPRPSRPSRALAASPLDG